MVAANDGSLLTQQTIGFSYSKDDAEKRWTLNAAGQYYYNGTGAAEPSLYRDRTLALMALLRQGELAAGNLRGYGSHYVAGTFGLSKIGGSTVSLACSGLASLSEGSWHASPRLSWVAGPDLTWALRLAATADLRARSTRRSVRRHPGRSMQKSSAIFPWRSPATCRDRRRTSIRS